jgi:hypothetical protein
MAIFFVRIVVFCLIIGYKQLSTANPRRKEGEIPSLLDKNFPLTFKKIKQSKNIQCIKDEYFLIVLFFCLKEKSPR